MAKKIAGIAVATLVVFVHCLAPYPPLSTFSPDR
jgi:hypothetical protein